MVDNVSALLLQRYSLWMMQQFVVAKIGAYGNCFFRAVSLALYSTEHAYTQLRILSVIEALLCRTRLLRRADELILSNSDNFIDGCYCDMLTVLVCSAVVQRQIQTRWPMPTREARAAPTTKRVTGRGIQPTSDVHTLWSCEAVSKPPLINNNSEPL